MGLTFIAGGSLLATALAAQMQTGTAPLTDDVASRIVPKANIATSRDAADAVHLAGFTLMDLLRGPGKPPSGVKHPELSHGDNDRDGFSPSINGEVPTPSADDLSKLPDPPSGPVDAPDITPQAPSIDMGGIPAPGQPPAL